MLRSILLVTFLTSTNAAVCVLPCDGALDPVCGADNQTYQNECVATCQNVTINSQGTCPGQSDHLVDSSRFLSSDDMTKFAADGLTLLGIGRASRFTPKAKGPDSEPGEIEPILADARELRITPDNLVYGGPALTTNDEEGELLGSSPLEIEPSGARRRLLTVFDNMRKEWKIRAPYPYSASGQLSLVGGPVRPGGLPNPLGGYCSGAMISRRTVLTAAHCVFDRQKNSHAFGVVFSPARYRDAQGVVQNPFGVQQVAWMATFQGWTNLNNPNFWPYDLAVLRLKDETVGQRTGWLGLSFTNGPYQFDVLSSGYPGDKPRGSHWYWDPACPVNDNNGKDGQLRHKCDVFPGQSGSPMQRDNRVRAVVSWQLPQVNGAAEITRTTFPALSNWR